ncbi:MAG: rhomboid family intramembrane serine protease [Cyanobacteria bacterium SZAS LIN-2]|nr:rhomboid family intramembrane serine protease [Cyanobacteria bacterium SZAS LIN-3]MBS1998797.1 rhomboid family intramembrane serine protease [Cyanobacteria bacterium SZAS LIN-2]
MFPLKDNLRCLNPATVTLWLIVANVLAFFWEVGMLVSGHGNELFGTYLMVPHNFISAFSSGDPSAIGWAICTVFTSMFLHGSFGHIFGNMVFLYVFGKGMENRIGKWNYLWFYLVCGVLATLTHAFSDTSSMAPTLGASGAIAGVLGGYLFFWPKATISGFYVYPAPAYVHTRAYWFLIGWFVMQFSGVLDHVGSVNQINNVASMLGTHLSAVVPAASEGGVAYWAHIGGFLGGFILAGIFRLVKPKSEVVCVMPEDNCKPDEKSSKGSK